MWEARARYKDRTEVDRLFEESPSLSEEEDQFRLEEWLIERHPGCVWYSVNWVED